MALPEAEGADAYASEVTFGVHHQGGPGIAHGGIVGAALDEACGLLATWHRFPAVTARIAIRYRRPAPINRTLRISSRVTADRGRRIEIAGELRDGDELLAEADGAFLHVPLEHFLATPEGRAAGESWARRLADARTSERGVGEAPRYLAGGPSARELDLGRQHVRLARGLELVPRAQVEVDVGGRRARRTASPARRRHRRPG